MKVKDLITWLENFPEDWEVKIYMESHEMMLPSQHYEITGAYCYDEKEVGIGIKTDTLIREYERDTSIQG